MMSNQLTKNNLNKLVERREAVSEQQAQGEAMEKAIPEEDYEARKKAKWLYPLCWES